MNIHSNLNMFANGNESGESIFVLEVGKIDEDLEPEIIENEELIGVEEFIEVEEGADEDIQTVEESEPEDD